MRRSNDDSIPVAARLVSPADASGRKRATQVSPLQRAAPKQRDGNDEAAGHRRFRHNRADRAVAGAVLIVEVRRQVREVSEIDLTIAGEISNGPSAAGL